MYKRQPYIDSGNTAWMVMATTLVFLMTIPGLAFFYGGLVRSKNILNVLMQCLVAAAVITLQWIVVGYSLSFGSMEGVLKPFIGGFDWSLLHGIGVKDISPYYISDATARIPHIVFILFQCMFAIITPALIIGAFAERIKFSGYLVFIIPVSYTHLPSVSGIRFEFILFALTLAGVAIFHKHTMYCLLYTSLCLFPEN